MSPRSKAAAFPYFFVGTFIEGSKTIHERLAEVQFPYFFVGTFIEGGGNWRH